MLQASPGWRLYHDWPRRLELAHQAAAAVQFMHSHNVVHRDLTSNNLLVTDKWEAKVCIKSAIVSSHQYPLPWVRASLVLAVICVDQTAIHLIAAHHPRAC